jgi:hypothetical protein
MSTRKGKPSNNVRKTIELKKKEMKTEIEFRRWEGRKVRPCVVESSGERDLFSKKRKV